MRSIMSHNRIMRKFVGVYIVLALFTRAYALECYQCNQVYDVKTCNTSRTCNTGETCFTNAVPAQQGVRYDMGCIEHNKCGNLTSSMSIIGRRELECHECCSRDHCNQALCQGVKLSSTCEDDLNEDCAKLDSLFHVCNDVPHARLICPRYCDLCEIVDGAWSGWTAWSACDVTCANGSQSRTRACNSPAPSTNGENCKGSDNEVQSCMNRKCPIHGSWTSWYTWGSCSVSCDIGIQQRSRSCSNPSPSTDGEYCHGDSRDDVICFQKPCADGNWSTWSIWSQCSVTCGTGLQKRQRQCDNPIPSLLGAYCTGSSVDVNICFDQACHAGGWSDWGSWSACSITCGGGLRSRSRTCTHPPPSDHGADCVGDLSDVQSCNSGICPEALVTPNVIFKARTVKNMSPNIGETLIFTTTMFNYGNGYNHMTGIFTVPINGIYSFTGQLCVNHQHTFYYAIVYDNTILTSGHLTDQYDDTCYTFDGMVPLTVGQRVWIKCMSTISDSLYEFSTSTANAWNTFSGMLVHP